MAFYIVKRKYVDVYQTGSQSFVAPRIYIRKADAIKVCKKENETRSRGIESVSLLTPDAIHDQAVGIAKHFNVTIDEFVEQYKQRITDFLNEETTSGEWVVAEVTLNIKELISTTE